MTLAWGLLFKLMPDGDRGAVAGLATWTKGAGLLIGPLLAGAAIDITGPYLDETQGYQIVWPIARHPGTPRPPAARTALGGRVSGRRARCASSSPKPQTSSPTT